MKKFQFLLLFFAFIMAFIMPLQLQAQTYDAPVNVTEGSTYVRYMANVKITAETATYTQAMLLAEANRDTAFIRAYFANLEGSEDVDVTIEFSNDLKKWTAGSATLITALGSSAVYDTLNVVEGAEYAQYHGSVWFRLVFSGQTSNPTNIATFDLFLPKNYGAPPLGAGQVANRRS